MRRTGHFVPGKARRRAAAGPTGGGATRPGAKGTRGSFTELLTPDPGAIAATGASAPPDPVHRCPRRRPGRRGACEEHGLASVGEDDAQVLTDHASALRTAGHVVLDVHRATALVVVHHHAELIGLAQVASYQQDLFREPLSGKRWRWLRWGGGAAGACEHRRQYCEGYSPRSARHVRPLVLHHRCAPQKGFNS